MNRLLIAVILLVTGVSFISQAGAADFNDYRKLANHTISEVESGPISRASVDKLIANQEKLIEIGVMAISEYIEKHPDIANVLNYVKYNASTMQNLNLAEIQTLWHEGGFMKSKGVDISKAFDKKSAVSGLVDTVVRPATVIIVLNEYKKKADKKYLQQVKNQLGKVLARLDSIK